MLFISESCSKELTRTGEPKEWLAKCVGFNINIETININIETAASVHACLQMSQDHLSNQASLLGPPTQASPLLPEPPAHAQSLFSIGCYMIMLFDKLFTYVCVCVEAKDNPRCCSGAIVLVLRQSFIYLKSAIGSGWMISKPRFLPHVS